MITIDISQIVYKGTGVARFVDGLTKQILLENEPDKFGFFFSGLRRKIPLEIEKEIKDKGFRLTKLPLPPKILSAIWNDLHILPADLFLSSDFFLSSDWTQPPTRSARRATIIHDLAFLRYPQTIHPEILKTQRKRLHWVVKETDIIITDSNATKNDIYQLIPKNADFLKLNKKDLERLQKIKIQTIYPGVQISQPDEKTEGKTLRKFDLVPKEYFFTVGKIEPRKNLKKLIQAFTQVKTDKKLVIAGPEGWDKLEIKDKRILFTGFVKDPQLYSLYKNAYAFISASLWEGFGYPLVESALLQTPVLCSDIEIYREILQNSALYFNPKKIDDITEKINQALENPKKLEEIKNLALHIIQKYSWKKYYQQLVSTMQNNRKKSPKHRLWYKSVKI